MKELLIQALDNAFEKLKLRVPQTKSNTISIPIPYDLNPVDFAQYVNDFHLPEDAKFDWGYDEITWETAVPLTDSQKVNYINDHFSSIAWEEVKKSFLSAGYQLIKYNSIDLISFISYRNPIVYELYNRKDWDTLVHLYSTTLRLIS
jgi:hypothetical protein